MSKVPLFERKFDMQNRLNTYRKQGHEINSITIEEMTNTVRDAIVTFQLDQQTTKIHQDMIDRCKGGDIVATNYIKQFMQFIMYNYTVKGYTHKAAINEIFKYLYGLDVIDEVYRNPKTEEIRVNDWDDIYQVIGGISHKVKGLKFRDRKAIEYLIARMTMHEGKEINMANPNIEAELFDGSRLTASISPETSAASFLLRKHNTIAFDTATLKQKGTVDDQMVEMLKVLIKGRSNILIIGGTNTGKTHTLKWMVDFINPGYRLCTLERVRELKLKDHYSGLGQERDITEFLELPNHGRTMVKQFQTLLRYSPDIIIVGEARGSEIVQMMNANISGHEGGIGTAHATTSKDAMNRLLEMQSLDGTNRDPENALRAICMAFDAIVLLKRYDDGARKIAEISFLSYDENTRREKLTILSRHTSKGFEYYPQEQSSFLDDIMHRFDQNGITEEDLKRVGILK